MDRVLVTGGTGAIGSAVIKKLSSSHVEIFFQYGDNQEYAKCLAEQYGADAIQWRAENADEQTIAQLFPSDIDVLINCIGSHISVGNMETVSVHEIKKLHQINVIAPFLFIKHVLPFMKKHKRGHILNVSSICGITTGENNLPYILSKHALTAMTKCIAAEYGQFGIICNEVCPNMIDSNMMQKIFQEESKRYHIPLDIYIKKVVKDMPDNSLLEPESVAQTILYLISDEMKVIKGQSIVLG